MTGLETGLLCMLCFGLGFAFSLYLGKFYRIRISFDKVKRE